MLDTNLWGLFTCSRYAIPRMVEGGGGSVVNIGSVAATVGFATDAAYCASKGAVHALTRQMALDYAKSGRARQLRRAGLHRDGAGARVPRQPRRPGRGGAETVALHPMGRMGRPEEVAAVSPSSPRTTPRSSPGPRTPSTAACSPGERAQPRRRSEMAGTILVGYDTETAAVGEALSLFTESPNFPLYALALDPDTCREALELLTEVHADVGVPATLFVCGRTLLHALEPVRAAHAIGPLRHAAAHLQPRAVQGHRLLARARASSARSPPPRREALLEELAFTSRLHPRAPRRRLTSACGRRSATTAACATGPTCSRSCAPAGLRYVTSWGRNEDNGNPTPWEVQPFTYEEEGYPDILELPFQFWLDVVWFDQHGYDTGPALPARRSRARSTRWPSATSSTAPASTTGSRSPRTSDTSAGCAASFGTRRSGASR